MELLCSYTFTLRSHTLVFQTTTSSTITTSFRVLRLFWASYGLRHLLHISNRQYFVRQAPNATEHVLQTTSLQSNWYCAKHTPPPRLRASDLIACPDSLNREARRPRELRNSGWKPGRVFCIVFTAPHALHLTSSVRVEDILLAIVVDDVSLNSWVPAGCPWPRSQQPEQRYPLPHPPRHPPRPAHAHASPERGQDTKGRQEES